MGTSFATTVAGTAISGEALYSWNMPLQISSGESLGARWIDNATGGGAGATVLPYDPTIGAFPTGYFREDVITAQLSSLTVLNPSSPVTQFLRADSTTLIANWGFQYLPSISDERLSVTSGGRGSEITHPNPGVQFPLYQNPTQPLVHADTFSHGYRLIGITSYNNAFDTPWTISPTIQWQHDVKGSSAGPIGPGFIDERMTVTLGVTADLSGVWRANVSYTNSFGNKFQNFMQDRDFVSASLSYAF